MKEKSTLWTIFCLFFALGVSAQISQPPSGDNQKAVVKQWMGLVSVGIEYSSPDVHGPSGEDRSGKIWGQLVPYGLSNQQFGLSTDENPSPWRAGANENTVIKFSHDVEVEGKPLKAGAYGLHMIPGETEWVVIFSKNSTAWGSYYYRASEDALRVTVKPAKCEYNEWLTYEFTDRMPASCTAQLKWEYLKVPFKISVPNPDMVYVEKIRQEMQNDESFLWQNVAAAANYCATKKVNLEEALTWADLAINEPFFGEKNFTTLQSKASVLYAMGRDAEAFAVVEESVKHPTATVMQVHMFGRQLINQNKKNEAMKIFQINAEKHPNDFTTLVGLARGYSAIGDYKKAMSYVETALPKAPNDINKKSMESALVKLKEGKDIN